MNHIPITFEHEGKQYSGFFNQVSGDNDTVSFHLYDLENFFLGRLRNENGWHFDPTPQTESFEHLADFFGEYIANWK